MSDMSAGRFVLGPDGLPSFAVDLDALTLRAQRFGAKLLEVARDPDAVHQLILHDLFVPYDPDIVRETLLQFVIIEVVTGPLAKLMQWAEDTP